ncbi:MAG: hypothetical protein H0U86_04120 [Chloroflexi bacterium]|nr:hypothetical protein [Chloroflexota bacterium]
MRRAPSLAGLVLVALMLAACPGPAPAPSETAGGPCSSDLPPRTSPTDYPVAVLYVAGDDLPPVVGEVEWLGGDEPVSHEPLRAVHLERFTVLQAQGQAEVSMRMSDGVRIEAWTVDAVPDGLFRGGDYESDRVRWSKSEGNEPTDVACIPVRDGEWTVIADVTFADDAGSGTYYWRLNVSQTPGA